LEYLFSKYRYPIAALKDKSKNTETKTWQLANFAIPYLVIENVISAKKMSAHLV
jgi:hypothetical protein